MSAPVSHGCALGAAAVTIDVPRGGVRAVEGIEFRFTGISRDEYVDGHFEVLATLRVGHGENHADRIVSALAPHEAEESFGRCWRLIRVDEQHARVVVSRLPGPPVAVRHLGGGKCEPMPREHSPCTDGAGYCVLDWGSPGGSSSALWCRDGRWAREEERNVP